MSCDHVVNINMSFVQTLMKTELGGLSRACLMSPWGRLLPERKVGSQPGGQWVLSNPAGPSCSLGNLILKLKCTSDVCFRIPEKNDFGGEGNTAF